MNMNVLVVMRLSKLKDLLTHLKRTIGAQPVELRLGVYTPLLQSTLKVAGSIQLINNLIQFSYCARDSGVSARQNPYGSYPVGVLSL